MVTSGRMQDRKEMTLKAHALLLDLDRKDISGNVVISFKKGEGICAVKIEEVLRGWNKWENNICVDNSSGK